MNTSRPHRHQMGSSVITIPLHGEAKSSATLLLSSAKPPNAVPSESDLLRKIKLVLRGSDTDHISSIQSSVFLNAVSDTWEEEELTWNAHTVVVGSGGVIRKKWNFGEEGQSIQWACIGLLEQGTFCPSLQAHNTARYADLDSEANARNSSDKPTFGPFAQLQREQKPEAGPVRLIPAVFVFLRSIGRIFLRNGFEYTFSLPFIVRKAWPISPHGVMIQRVLEPTELHEAEITGDPVLPTIFSMTSPFAEAAAIGLTTGIIGGVEGTPAELKDEDENSTKPLKAIASTEMVAWASHRGPHAADDILVTVDVEQKRLSIWRYVYVKPKDAPVPFGHSTTQSFHRKRQSMGGNSSRRTSAIYNDVFDRRHNNISPGRRSREPSPVPEIRDVHNVSSLPGMPTSLSTAATMATLATGATSSQSQWSANGRTRRDSLARNDASVTMDRMVLGGRMDLDILAPIEHGRMKASYWVEQLYTQELDEKE